MGTGRKLAWWEIPDWVGERKLRSARIWTGSITLGLFFAATAAPADPAYGPWGSGIAAVLGALISRSKRMKPGRLRRERLPRAMVPCWPRSWRDRVSLVAGVGTGLFVRRKLIRRRTFEEEGEVVLEPPEGSRENGVVPDLLFLKVPEG